MARDGERILTDEQVLERGETVHRVPGPDPDDALVGLDTDNRHREGPSRDGVPGGHERRIERYHQTLPPNGGDFHDRSITDAAALASRMTATVL